VRGEIVPRGDLPVPRGRERVRLLVRRVFLRGRFAPLAIPLNVIDAARRSPGGLPKPEQGCECEEDGGMPGDWGTLVLIAVVVLIFLFSGGGGG
jgi:hypothetical protein